MSKMDKVKFLTDVIIAGNLTVAGTHTSESSESVHTKGALTVINSDNNFLASTLMGTVIRTGKNATTGNPVRERVAPAAEIGSFTYFGNSWGPGDSGAYGRYCIGGNVGEGISGATISEDQVPYYQYEIPLSSIPDQANICVVQNRDTRSWVGIVSTAGIVQASEEEWVSMPAGEFIYNPSSIIAQLPLEDQKRDDYYLLVAASELYIEQTPEQSIDYAIVYNPSDEEIQIGVGSYNEQDNSFAFHEGEGLPIAVRNLTDTDNGYLVEWDASGRYLKRASVPVHDGSGINAVVLNDLFNSNADGSYSSVGGLKNKALSRNTVAYGESNTAGSKAFRIVKEPEAAIMDENEQPTGYYYLSSVDGIEVGQNYIVRLSSVSRTLSGKILAIDPDQRSVLVDNYDQNLKIEPGDYNFDEKDDFSAAPSACNYLCILERPDLGDTSVGFHAVAFGEYNIAAERGAASFGRNNKSLGQYAFTEGYLNEANYGSHAEGHKNKASGVTAHAEGRENTASGYASHSEGAKNTASGETAHAEGCQTIASGNYSHAEGSQTKATGSSSHAEGFKVNAIGSRSHAEGDIEDSKYSDGSYMESSFNRVVTVNATNYVNDGHAHGHYSHREGRNTSTYGNGSHAEGLGTMSISANSHAEGYKTTAGGSAAHAEGSNTSALGDYSHASGLHTTAAGSCQTVIGKYNAQDTTSLFIVGNGTGTSAATRKSIFTVAPNLQDKEYANATKLSDAITLGYLQKYIEEELAGGTW